MNIPTPYQVDGHGGRRGAASETPPLSYWRAPIRELRALPTRRNPRLRVLDYRLTDAPGMTPTRKPRTHGHGAARLAGGFVLLFCLTRDGGEWWLEVQLALFDEALDRRLPLALTPQILADLYRDTQGRQSVCEARAYGRGEGRN